MFPSYGVIAVERSGDTLTVACHPDIIAEDNLYARYELMLVMATGATRVESRNDTRTVMTVSDAAKYVGATSSVAGLSGAMADIAEGRIIIRPSKSLVAVVEVGFVNPLGCLPFWIADDLGTWGARNIVIAPDPAYDNCVLQPYIPEHDDRPWAEVEAELRAIINFDL